MHVGILPAEKEWWSRCARANKQTLPKFNEERRHRDRSARLSDENGWWQKWKSSNRWRIITTCNTRNTNANWQPLEVKWVCAPHENWLDDSNHTRVIIALTPGKSGVVVVDKSSHSLDLTKANKLNAKMKTKSNMPSPISTGCDLCEIALLQWLTRNADATSAHNICK